MSSLSPVARAVLRSPANRVQGNGITAAIFGCTGQLGRYVCAELGLHGHTMVLPYRGDEMEVRHLKLMGDLGTVANVPFHPRDRESIRDAVRGADVVINLVGKYYQTKHLLPWWINYTYDEMHVDIAQSIAEVAAEEGVPRFIHHSSILAKPNSPSIWAASKYRGELAVKKAFPNANIVRSSAFFGPEDQLLTWAAERLKFGAIPLVENGEAVLQPVFVNDVATAIYNVSQDPTINGEVFEFVGDDEYTYKELADYVFDATTRTGSLLNLPLPVAKVIGKFCEQFPSPIFTEEWAVRLALDQVKESNLPGLRELDVVPTNLEKEAPNFMVKFKPGGHFQEVSGYH